MAALAGEVVSPLLIVNEGLRFRAHTGEVVSPLLIVNEGLRFRAHAAEKIPEPTEIIHEHGYRMRAYDQTLAETVYWTAIYIDSTGTEYTGPGPVVNIIVSHVIGT